VELSEVGCKFSKDLCHWSWNSSNLRSVHVKCDDGSLREDDTLTRFGELMNAALIASGRASPSEQLLRDRLEKAGYVDVQSFSLRLPIGPWAKDK
jgi:hypothetical protein